MDADAKAKARRSINLAIGLIAGGLIGAIVYLIGLIAGKDPYDPTPMGQYIAWNFDAASPMFIFLIALGALFGAWLARARWTVVGTLLYMSLIVTVTGFILYSATVSLPRRFSPLNLLLFLAESVSLIFVVIYAYYTIDRVSRREWTRHYESLPKAPNAFPKVEIQVPLYNEPPHVVMEVLDHLLKLDYPSDCYRVVVADDSTDEDARMEVEAFCRDHPKKVTYFHRADRRGFKAGALNEALRQTPAEYELIAVIDADFKVEPNFLKETVGYFEENPDLGFLQTPQDFHNIDYSDFTRQIYRANRFFFDAIMPARNEVNSIIFCGTMGIVRRKALVEAGGWGEDTLTEDAETSIRIVDAGWQSLYIPKVYGRGLLPQSFSAYKSQQYRWAFGGVQVVKKHLWKVLSSRLTGRQRMDLLTGGLHYFSGAILTTIACILLIFGIGEFIGWEVTTFHRGEVLLMGLVPFFIMGEGLLRMRWALGKTMGLSFRETMEVMGVWFSISMLTTLAALRAVIGSKQAFARTPKYRARKVGWARAWARGISLTRVESTLAWCLGVTGLGLLLVSLMNVRWILSYGIATILTSFVLSLWLLWYAYVFGCAPIYAARGGEGKKGERRPKAKTTGAKRRSSECLGAPPFMPPVGRRGLREGAREAIRAGGSAPARVMPCRC